MVRSEPNIVRTSAMTFKKARNTPGRGENRRGGEVLLRAVYGTFEYCGSDAVFENGNIMDCNILSEILLQWE